MTDAEDSAGFLAKAIESLASAEADYAADRYSSCANRCYYACFQAAISALLAAGIRAPQQWGHGFVQAQFSGRLIDRRKRYPATLRSVLGRLMTTRGAADYDPAPVDRSSAERALRAARAFVEAIRQEATP